MHIIDAKHIEVFMFTNKNRFQAVCFHIGGDEACWYYHLVKEKEKEWHIDAIPRILWLFINYNIHPLFHFIDLFENFLISE